MIDLYQPPAIILPGEPWQREVTRYLARRGVPLSKRQDIVREIKRALSVPSKLLRPTIADLGTFAGVSLAGAVPGVGASAAVAGGAAPAPVIVGTPATFFNNSAANTHNFNLPSGITSGELLLGFAGAQANVGGNWDTPAGWTELFDTLNGASSGALACFAKIATGSEGSTLACTKPGTTTRVAGVFMRISGAALPSTSNAASVGDSGASTTPNPPSLTTGSDSGKNLLWLAAMNSQHNNYPSVYPTNYSLVAVGQGTTATGATVAVAQRTLAPAASEDPDAWTTPNSSRWVGATVFIAPA